MSARRNRGEQKDLLVPVVSGLVIVILIALYIHHVWFQDDQSSAPAPAPVAEAPPPAEPPTEPQVRYPIEASPDSPPLPPLEESDSPIRESLAELLDAVTLERLFRLDGFVRRFVITVDELPRGRVPQRYSLARPLGDKFAVAGREETLAIHSHNYTHYAPYVRLAETIDTGKLVAVYTYFYPLLQEEYRNIGEPNKYFNDRVVEAIDDLLAAPEFAQPPRLVQNKVLYEYVDPKLEELSAGQKIMIRMGSDNAARIKAKLREIRSAIVSMQ